MYMSDIDNQDLGGLKKLAKKVKKAVKKVAKVALPVVGAVGGGILGAKAGSLASNLITGKKKKPAANTVDAAPVAAQTAQPAAPSIPAPVAPPAARAPRRARPRVKDSGVAEQLRQMQEQIAASRLPANISEPAPFMPSQSPQVYPSSFDNTPTTELPEVQVEGKRDYTLLAVLGVGALVALRAMKR